MKKLLTMMLCLMLVLGVVGTAHADKLSDIKESGKLIVGSQVDFPPYEFYFTNENGEEELAGFEMMLAKGLAEELGVELEVADQAFAGLINALNAGEIDLIISGMSAKPERREVIDFSDSYFSGTQVVAVHKDNLEKYTTVESLDGKTLGAQTGALQQTVAEEQFPNTEHVLLPKMPVLMMELDAGNVDAVIVTDTVAKSYMTVYPNIVISEIPVEYSGDGSAVGVAKGDNEMLLAAINAYIEKVKASGEFDQWVDVALEQNGILLQNEVVAEEETSEDLENEAGADASQEEAQATKESEKAEGK